MDDILRANTPIYNKELRHVQPKLFSTQLTAAAHVRVSPSNISATAFNSTTSLQSCTNGHHMDGLTCQHWVLVVVGAQLQKKY